MLGVSGLLAGFELPCGQADAFVFSGGGGGEEAGERQLGFRQVRGPDELAGGTGGGGRGIANGGAELVGTGLGLAAGDGSEAVDCPFHGAEGTEAGGAVYEIVFRGAGIAAGIGVIGGHSFAAGRFEAIDAGAGAEPPAESAGELVDLVVIRRE